MTCKNCSKKIDDDSKFCQFCGEKIEPKKESLLDVEKEFIDHLEFLGYEIEETDAVGKSKRYFARHKTRELLLFHNVDDIGLSFVSFYSLDPNKVKKNTIGILEIINRMNFGAWMTSFSLNEDFVNFLCSAFYVGKYNKKQFSDFLDLYDNDIKGRLRAEDKLINFS